jgi:hypothetical protein
MSFSGTETERKHWNVKGSHAGLVVRSRKLIDPLSLSHTTFNVKNTMYAEKLIIFVVCVSVVMMCM